MKSDRVHALWTSENFPHFITSVTNARTSIFREAASANLLMNELHHYALRHNVLLIAAVVMPDHFHCIIWPQGNKTFSEYMKGVKGHSAKVYSDVRRGAGTPPMGEAKTLNVWQDSFFDYLVPDETKLEEKIRYIAWNPVEEGLVGNPRQYPHLFVHPDYMLPELE